MNWAETMDQLRTPCELNMPLSPAKIAKSTNTITVPQMPPSSGRISAFAQGGGLFDAFVAWLCVRRIGHDASQT